MTKLYVGNLAFGMTDDSLLQLFIGKGYKVASARVITDRETGRSRGFGFVELGPEVDATKAIGEFNGMNIEGRELQVNDAFGIQTFGHIARLRQPDLFQFRGMKILG